MELISVTSEAKKYNSEHGEPRFKKIRVCCGHSGTDKNPRRVRNKEKFCAYHSFSEEKSHLCACSTQFVPCMFSFRGTWSAYAASVITYFQIRAYVTMASG
jgi:hypothetical protein